MRLCPNNGLGFICAVSRRVLVGWDPKDPRDLIILQEIF